MKRPIETPAPLTDKAKIMAFITASGGAYGQVNFYGSDDDGTIGAMMIFNAKHNQLSVDISKEMDLLIATMVEDLILTDHMGWDSNHGSQGEFIFNTDDNTIEMSIDVHYIHSKSHFHTY